MSAERTERRRGAHASDNGQLICPAGFPVPPGTKEWFVQKGDKGDKGDRGAQGEQGDKGDRGMPTGQRRAIIYLFVLTLLLAGANLLWTAHEHNITRADEAAVQAQQRQQGAVIGRKLCATLDDLRSLQPPSGNPASNPSRAYEQGLHARLSQLGTDLGCK